LNDDHDRSLGAEASWIWDLIGDDLPLWAGLPAEARADFMAALEPISIAGGRELFVQGEPADALYVLAAGSLGISATDAAGRWRPLARISPPDTVGEMALISDAPRSATTVALRDSILLRLSRDGFDRLLERWPRAMVYFARLLAERLRGAASAYQPASSGPKTFAVIAASDGAPASELGEAFFRELQRQTGARGVMLTGLPAEADEAWFHRLEAGNDRVVFVSSTPSGQWAGICRRRADHVLLVTEPGRPLRLQGVAEEPIARDWRKSDLVVLQVPNAGMPAPADQSWADLCVNLHLHVRRGDHRDLARLVRTVTRRALGLVFSGGGARGFAHIGVLHALHEAGRGPDLVGGTSIGAIIGACAAAGWSIEAIKDKIRQSFATDPPLNDFTFPAVALLRGRKVDARLEQAFGGLRIEDLWLPFLCISSNLTSGKVHTHSSGPLVQALRASIAIPGLLPPVVGIEGVLADGAMLNNLPADVIADLNRGPVVAVDVARDLALQPRTSLLRRLLGVPAEMPMIGSILLRSATISSDAQVAAMRSRATVILQPALASVGLRSWASFDRAVAIGYECARAAIDNGLLSELTAAEPGKGEVSGAR
jgi:NTE family protein